MPAALQDLRCDGCALRRAFPQAERMKHLVNEDCFLLFGRQDRECSKAYRNLGRVDLRERQRHMAFAERTPKAARKDQHVELLLRRSAVRAQHVVEHSAGDTAEVGKHGPASGVAEALTCSLACLSQFWELVFELQTCGTCPRGVASIRPTRAQPNAPEEIRCQAPRHDSEHGPLRFCVSRAQARRASGESPVRWLRFP
jgi:hypothetical protein